MQVPTYTDMRVTAIIFLKFYTDKLTVDGWMDILFIDAQP